MYLNRSEYTSSAYTNCPLRFNTPAGTDNAGELPMSLIVQQAYTLSPEALNCFRNIPTIKGFPGPIFLKS
jgi:hypothetical protein